MPESESVRIAQSYVASEQDSKALEDQIVAAIRSIERTKQWIEAHPEEATKRLLRAYLNRSPAERQRYSLELREAIERALEALYQALMEAEDEEGEEWKR
ncbi:MAG TPA: hypothetical protein VGQ69_04780 [Gemmatimonadales bacterium]|jgi:hypothetical protein|nr:hypothetical protein [Gemmatimonadales bacterium]